MAPKVWSGTTKRLVDKIVRIPPGGLQRDVALITLAFACPYILEQLERIAQALEDKNNGKWKARESPRL